MALIDRLDKYHLCYLIVNDITDDHFDGLSHVVEHTLLTASSIEVESAGRGYTCANHVWLCFSNEKIDVLTEIDRLIFTGEIITQENVDMAKSQVKDEIMRLQGRTDKNNRLIHFITEGRIEKFSMGDVEQINQIQVTDVRTWFEKNKKCCHIFRFLFKDANSMIFTSVASKNQIIASSYCDSMSDSLKDAYLYVDSPYEAQYIHVYFRIPILRSKEDTIRKAFYEFCIHRKLSESFGIETNIADNFFDINERYVRMDFEMDKTSTVEDMVSKIRAAVNSLSKIEIEHFFYEFKDCVLRIMCRTEYNSEVINSIKNGILYEIPHITLKDVEDFDLTQVGEFPKERITLSPLKVIIS